MDIFQSVKTPGGRPDEWNRKLLLRGCQRKLNFCSTGETQKLPRVNISEAGQVSNALTWASRSSHHLDSARPADYAYYSDTRDKKKTVARRHLMGSLSAPMKTTAVVRTTSIGRSLGSPPRGYPDVRQTFEIDPSNRKPGGDHLQGIDKINNIFQRRLDLKVQKPEPYQNLPTRIAPTSLQNRENENSKLRRPLFMTTDVGQLSDVNDLLSEDYSDGSFCNAKLTKSSADSQQKRPPRVTQVSQHRPLTPNLMKKLNKMKLSAFTTTQLWVNQLPQETPVFNRQLAPHASRSETTAVKHGNNMAEKIQTRWIYGADR